MNQKNATEIIGLMEQIVTTDHHDKDDLELLLYPNSQAVSANQVFEHMSFQLRI